MNDLPVFSSPKRTIETTYVEPGMHVLNGSIWWMATQVLDRGITTGTRIVAALRLDVHGQPRHNRPTTLWLPITRFGTTVRAGIPAETTIGGLSDVQRVVYRPRRKRDTTPYIDARGGRHSRYETAAWRTIETLAAIYAKAHRSDVMA